MESRPPAAEAANTWTQRGTPRPGSVLHGPPPAGPKWPRGLSPHRAILLRWGKRPPPAGPAPPPLRGAAPGTSPPTAAPLRRPGRAPQRRAAPCSCPGGSRGVRGSGGQRGRRESSGRSRWATPPPRAFPPPAFRRALGPAPERGSGGDTAGSQRRCPLPPRPQARSLPARRGGVGGAQYL